MPPPSRRMRLLVFLLAAIVLAGAVQGALAYRGALDEADALFDYHMQQTALALRSGLPVDAQGLGPGLEPGRRQWAQRRARPPSPVSDAHLPDDVRPLVSKLNLLFERVQRAFGAQE